MIVTAAALRVVRTCRDCRRLSVTHIRPGERLARRGLGGEAEVVVAVFALDVGELVLAVLEIAQVLGGVERRREPGRDALRSRADRRVEPA